MNRAIALVSSAIASVYFANGAKADFFNDFRIDIGLGHNRPAVERVWVEPVYQTQIDRVWVEPADETRCDRVWHEAVYEDRCERVLIPDRWETRCETTRDFRGRLVTRDVRVLVESAHYESRTAHILVREGWFEDVSRQVCVREGHWADSPRQVCVREGYWAQQPVACDVPATNFRIGYERESNRGGDRHVDRSGDRSGDHREDHERYDRAREDRSPRQERSRRN